MKKTWIVILTLLLVVGAVTMMVSADTTLPEKCVHCDKAVTWTKLSEVADGAETIPAGHYYYDYEEATHAWTAVKGVSGAVCIYVPTGKTITGPNRVFTVNNGGTLSIMGEGTVAGVGYTDNAATAGTVSVGSGGKLYLHSGTLTVNLAEGRQVKTGGVVYVSGGELHISGGQITGGVATANGTKSGNAANGGNVYLHGSAKMFMSDGSITAGTAAGTASIKNSYCAGGNVYVNSGCTVEMSGGTISGGSANVGNDVSTRGRFILSGDACVNQLRLSPVSSGHVRDTLGISGVYTGTVNLQAAENYLVEGTEFGTATNASILRATININNVSNKPTDFYLAVGEDGLYVTKTQPTYTKNAYCEKCGQNVDWTLLTESAASASTIAPGHYYIDILPDSAMWAQKTISGKVCLDLNGMDLKFTSRAFLVDTGATLSIQGDGSITSGGFASGTANNSRLGGVIMSRAGSEVNLYGGTLTTVLAAETNIYAYNGGIVWCAGAFNMYGGSLKNGQATYAAGNLFLQTNSTALLAGGEITGGTAKTAGNDIYSKGHITLTGSPSITSLSHKDDGSLNVKGNFTGSILLELSSYSSRALGSATENASIRKANITLDTTAKRYIAIVDGALWVSDSEPVYVEKTETRYCEACGRNATFRAVTEDFSDDASITTGHFFLDFQGGVGVMKPRMVSGSGRVCIDLNGQTWKSTGRVFDVRDACFLNIMDSVGGGLITGCGPTGSSGQFGGTMFVRNGAELNLYSGTISYYEPTDDRPEVARGGVIYTEGDFNMYGGAVSGGVSTTGAGVYAAASSSGVSRVALYGGTISGGKATRVGDGLIYGGYLTLSGDADIVNIRFSSNAYSPARGDAMMIEGTYTGTTEFTFAELTVGADVGNSVNADISGATISSYNLSGAKMKIVGNDLVFIKNAPAVVTQKQDGTSATYASLSEAIAAFNATTDSKLVLFADAVDVEVSKDVYLDLNGYNITGSITGEGKLYCMDSATDDYDVKDGKYGTVTKAANVAAVALDAACAEDGYLMVEEANGTLSFHRLTLNVKSMSLRPNVAGLYFKSAILCDDVAAGEIESFGVALDLKGEPSEDKIGVTTVCTVFGKEMFGGNDNDTSTLVTGVLKNSRSDADNNTYAGMPIYAKVYITLEDGTMIFGECRSRSLKEQIAGINADDNFIHVSIAQKRALMDMYYAFESVMGGDGWSASNLVAIANRKKQFTETDYTPYLAPYTAEMLEAAKTDGKVHYFFMAGEGMHISDGQTYKDKWGDAYLIVFPNGQLMLVDCGPLSYAPVLYKNLEKMGITYIDYMLISHPHSDHQNGIFADSAILNVGLLDKIEIGQIYYRGGWDPDRLDDTIVDRIAPQYGIPYEAVEKGKVLEIGGVRLEVVWPLEGDGNSYISGGQEINDMSVVVRMDYGEHSSLLTGDLYTTGENMILERIDNDLLDVDFLKTPHHGYATSSSSAFLEAISPELAVSIGRLPIPSAIYDRYESLGIEFLDDRQKGYIHVCAGTDGVLEYTTSRESFEGTTPDAGDEGQLPDADEGDDN